MLAHLFDVSLRALILAIAAFVFQWVAGRRCTAALQHAVCTTIVCGMLALFVFGDILPRFPLRILNAPEAAPRSLYTGSSDRPSIDINFPAIAGIDAPPRTRTLHWQDLALYGYIAVTLPSSHGLRPASSSHVA